MNRLHQHRRSHISTLRRLSGAAVAAAAISVAIPMTAQGAVACNGPALVAAINAANAAGGANVVLEPLCTYNLTTSSSNGTSGPNGLPIIRTAITLTGDQNLITRSGAIGTPQFRIVEVAPTGKLTVKLTTLNNGNTAFAGGGVLNFGAVTLTGSELTNNRAALTGGGLHNAPVASPGTGTTATFTTSKVTGNTAAGQGGGIYSGLRGTLTTTSTSIKSNNSSAQRGGGIAAIDATATTLTSSPVTINNAGLGAGGIYRSNGTMTITSSPITFNTPGNCVGSVPVVTGCVG